MDGTSFFRGTLKEIYAPAYYWLVYNFFLTPFYDYLARFVMLVVVNESFELSEILLFALRVIDNCYESIWRY